MRGGGCSPFPHAHTWPDMERSAPCTFLKGVRTVMAVSLSELVRILPKSPAALLKSVRAASLISVLLSPSFEMTFSSWPDLKAYAPSSSFWISQLLMTLYIIPSCLISCPPLALWHSSLLVLLLFLWSLLQCLFWHARDIHSRKILVLSAPFLCLWHEGNRIRPENLAQPCRGMLGE